MKNTHFLFAAPVLIVLAATGCKQQPETVNGYGDPMAAELANAAPVDLPPALKASKTYRCKDNSLVYIDYMSDDMTAHLRTEKGGQLTVLKAPEAGKPFEAEGGYKVEGNGDSVTIAVPGKGAQSCKA